uniref:F-box domain-containing protein n=1 Tax=Mycena chlorophos TaxID=658473 RepID=A0ABQ0MB64_MYCCL|nr:predicted protein [Mycena chlorophos]
MDSLPTELLAHIFHLGLPTTLFGERIPPQLLTAVCSRWRHLIHALPEFWTDIRVHDANFTQNAADLVDQHILLSREEPLRVSLRTNDVSQRGQAHFLAVISKLLSSPVINRWLSVRLALTNTHLEMLHPFGRRAPSNVEYLELRLLQGLFVNELSRMLELRRNPPQRFRSTISFGAMPRLKTFIAERVELDVLSAPFATELTTLAFNWCLEPGFCDKLVADIQAKVSALAEAAAAEDPDAERPTTPPPLPNPALRTLRLGGPIPQLIKSSPDLRDSFLRCVTTLELVSTPAHDFRPFAGAILAMRPTLAELRLTTVLLPSLILALNGPPAAPNPQILPVFTELRTLHINTCEWSPGMTQQLSTLFPGVHTLLLRSLHFPSPTAQGRHMNATSFLLSLKSNVFPELRALHLVEMAFGLDRLVELVAARQAHAHAHAQAHVFHDANALAAQPEDESPSLSQSHDGDLRPLDMLLVVEQPPVVNISALRSLRQNLREFRMVAA